MDNLKENLVRTAGRGRIAFDKVIWLIALGFICLVSYFESGYSWVLIAFSVSLVIPLGAIYFYIRIKPIRVSIYLYQLTIFSIFYPVTWIIGYLFAPSIFSLDLYVNALWAFGLFIFFFISSYCTFSWLFHFRVKLGRVVEHALPNIKSMYIMFFVLLATVIFLRWYNGILFHIAINPDYNFNAGSVENIAKILTSLCVVPSILLIIFGNGKTLFNKHAYILLLIFVLVHMPTGLRSATIIPLVAFVLIGAFYGSLKFKSIMVLASLMIFSVVLQGNLRVDAEDRSTSLDDNSLMFVQRMSDLRNTGLMIDLIDNTYKPRWFDKLDNFILCYPPNLIRSILAIPCNTGESTDFTQEIGVAPSHSSEPITIIGDAFSRFGIFGVAIIGFLFGFLVFFVDWLISKLRTEVAIVYFVVFSQQVFSVYSASFLNMLLIFCRDSIILFVIFSLVARYFRFGLKSQLS